MQGEAVLGMSLGEVVVGVSVGNVSSVGRGSVLDLITKELVEVELVEQMLERGGSLGTGHERGEGLEIGYSSSSKNFSAISLRVSLRCLTSGSLPIRFKT